MLRIGDKVKILVTCPNRKIAGGTGTVEYMLWDYYDAIAFYVNPAPNTWLFDIPDLGINVELTCDNNGKITEVVKNVK